MLRKEIFILLLTIFFLVPTLVFAQTGLGALTKNLGDTGSAAGISESGDLQSIVGTGINAALTLIGLIFMILMVYAGYLWMTARGSDEIITKAKGIVTAAIIGLVLVVSAYAITAFVTGRFETSNEPIGCCKMTNSDGAVSCTPATAKECDVVKGTVTDQAVVFGTLACTETLDCP